MDDFELEKFKNFLENKIKNYDSDCFQEKQFMNGILLILLDNKILYKKVEKLESELQLIKELY
jgi:hypothetical protein